MERVRNRFHRRGVGLPVRTIAALALVLCLTARADVNVSSQRVLCAFTASAVAGVTTEGLITLTPYRDLVAGSTATTFAVTAGKRLRLQAITVTWRNNTAAAGAVTIRFRTLAGTVLVGSPVQLSLNATTASAAIGGGNTASINFPDGMELSGTMQFGLTQLALGAVVGFDVHVTGYEY